MDLRPLTPACVLRVFVRVCACMRARMFFDLRARAYVCWCVHACVRVCRVMHACARVCWCVHACGLTAAVKAGAHSTDILLLDVTFVAVGMHCQVGAAHALFPHLEGTDHKKHHLIGMQ